MNEELFEVPSPEFNEAMKRYYYFLQLNRVGLAASFNEWLGSHSKPKPWISSYRLSREAYNKVQMLLSPHWYTLMMVMKARTDDKGVR